MMIDKATLLAALSSASALICFLASTRAAYRHRLKRWLWVTTAIMSLYLSVVYAGVATSLVPDLQLVSILVRPSIGPLFIIICAHALIDSRRRPPQ